MRANICRKKDERANLCRKKDERAKTKGRIFANKTRLQHVREQNGMCRKRSYMKSIVGGVLEYRNADGRLQHIHEPDVTSSLKENEKGPLDCLV